MPGSTISSHLPMLLELNVQGMGGEIFGASPIAIPVRTCTQSTHSDVWLLLATTPECLFKIGDRQSEKKRWNGDRRVICNATRGIDARRVVIGHRGVSDGSDGVRSLWWSHSAQTEMFFADEGSQTMINDIVGQIRWLNIVDTRMAKWASMERWWFVVLHHWSSAWRLVAAFHQCGIG